jgi:hypothetical protein
LRRDASLTLREECRNEREGELSCPEGRATRPALEGSRYQLEGELARGGMGAILKVWDEDLRRSLASQPRALHRPAVCPSHTSSRELRP